MDISKLSKEEKAELLRKLKEEEKTESIQRKETYEALRHQFMFDVESKLMPVVNDVQGIYINPSQPLHHVFVFIPYFIVI